MGCRCSKPSPGNSSDRSTAVVRRQWSSKHLASCFFPCYSGESSEIGNESNSVCSSSSFLSSCHDTLSTEIDPTESEMVTTFPGSEEECIAAGWPSWLVAPSGEALYGWKPRRMKSFVMHGKIGKGSFGTVYKAWDKKNRRVVALKKLEFFDADEEGLEFLAREFRVLRKLNHPNVVKLEGLIASRQPTTLHLVLEYVDHPLSYFIRNDTKLSETQVKSYMQQLFRGLNHCHSRGVLHRDLGTANVLVDRNGVVKIADFGLSRFFDLDKRQDFTNNVFCLWNRPPELLLGDTKYGVAADLWSAGCVFAELLLGRPALTGLSEIDQLDQIFELCGMPPENYWEKRKATRETIFRSAEPQPSRIREVFKDFSPSAVALLEVLLSLEPKLRGTATSALEHEFFF